MQPTTNSNTNLPCPANFIDQLQERLDVRNDAQLARYLRLQPPQISKLRHGILPLTAEIILRIHEAAEIPVAEIRSLARLPAPVYPEWIDVVTKPADRRRAQAAALAA